MHPVEVDACFQRRSRHRGRLAELAEPLTPRESEVLQMLASGLAIKKYAAKLVISEHTRQISRGVDLSGKLGAGAAPKLSLSGIRRGPRSSMTSRNAFLMKSPNWKNGGLVSRGARCISVSVRPLKVTQRRLGHSDSCLTLNVYT